MGLSMETSPMSYMPYRLWLSMISQQGGKTIENNEFQVHLKYEKREPLIENLDLVVNFDKEFRVRMP